MTIVVDGSTASSSVIVVQSVVQLLFLVLGIVTETGASLPNNQDEVRMNARRLGSDKISPHSVRNRTPVTSQGRLAQQHHQSIIL